MPDKTKDLMWKKTHMTHITRDCNNYRAYDRNRAFSSHKPLLGTLQKILIYREKLMAY